MINCTVYGRCTLYVMAVVLLMIVLLLVIIIPETTLNKKSSTVRPSSTNDGTVSFVNCNATRENVFQFLIE
jgi:competence protein ComGC